MKKIITISIFIFMSVITLFATTNSSIMFEKLDKVTRLSNIGSDYEHTGQYIKLKKVKTEIKTILDSMFYNGKIIKSDENMVFNRIKGSYGRNFYFDSYGEFGTKVFQYSKEELKGKEFMDGEPEGFRLNINFKVLSSDDCFKQEIKTISTPDDILEKFEETDAFLGKIQIVNRGFANPETYEILYLDGELHITVFCKILEIK